MYCRYEIDVTCMRIEQVGSVMWSCALTAVFYAAMTTELVRQTTYVQPGQLNRSFLERHDDEVR